MEPLSLAPFEKVPRRVLMVFSFSHEASTDKFCRLYLDCTSCPAQVLSKVAMCCMAGSGDCSSDSRTVDCSDCVLAFGISVFFGVQFFWRVGGEHIHQRRNLQDLGVLN